MEKYYISTNREQEGKYMIWGAIDGKILLVEEVGTIWHHVSAGVYCHYDKGADARTIYDCRQ
jgi:hypothetical protein